MWRGVGDDDIKRVRGCTRYSRVMTARLPHFVWLMLISFSIATRVQVLDRAEDSQLRVNFEAKANAGEQTLRVRHRDLRLVWNVLVNGKEVGRLPQDENAMVSLIALPPGTLKDGANTIQVGCSEKTSQADDI